MYSKLFLAGGLIEYLKQVIFQKKRKKKRKRNKKKTFVNKLEN